MGKKSFTHQQIVHETFSQNQKQTKKRYYNYYLSSAVKQQQQQQKFITAQTWKLPRWPSAGEWINKWWYIQTIDYYSALKRNELQGIKRHGGTLNAYY